LESKARWTADRRLSELESSLGVAQSDIGTSSSDLGRNEAVEIRLPLTLTLSPLAGRGESKSETYPPIGELPATSKTDPLAPFDGERVRVRGNPAASFRLSGHE